MATFWKDTADFLITGMGTDLFAKSTNLISHIAPLFSMGFGIYFMIVILNAYNRGFDSNTIDLAKKTVAWLIIIICAFNAAQYQRIANALYEMPEWLAGTFTNSTYNISAIDTAWDSLMQCIENILATAANLDWDDFGNRIALNIITLLVFMLGGLFFGIVLSFYIVTKLSLAMVLLIGPLFLGMMLFPSTRQYCMNWIGQILNYSITISFFNLLSALQMDFFKNAIEPIITKEFESFAEVFAVMPLFIVSTIIFVIVAWSIPSIASALTGGASIGGFSNFGRVMGNNVSSIGMGNAGKDGVRAYHAGKKVAQFMKNKFAGSNKVSGGQ